MRTKLNGVGLRGQCLRGAVAGHILMGQGCGQVYWGAQFKMECIRHSCGDKV